MTCFYVGNKLAAYLAHEVTEEEKAQIEDHLQMCQQCQEELELLKLVEESLNSLATETPSKNFTDQIMTKVQSLPTKNSKTFNMKLFGNLVASFTVTVLLSSVLFHYATQISTYASTIEKYGKTVEYNVTHLFKPNLKMKGDD